MKRLKRLIAWVIKMSIWVNLSRLIIDGLGSDGINSWLKPRVINRKLTWISRGMKSLIVC